MTTASRPFVPHAVGTAMPRPEGPQKVRGTARYTVETPGSDALYLFPVQAGVARGRVTAIDTSAAEALEGVVAVLTHENAPRLAREADADHGVLQSSTIHQHGQYLAAVLATSSESAREAASLVSVEVVEEPHAAVLDEDSPDLYTPEALVVGVTDDTRGDPEAALAASAVTLRRTYRTPMEHHQPLEPHATVACWEDGRLVVHDATQAVSWTRQALAAAFGLDESDVDVVAQHVGGGFGSKGGTHPNTMLTALAAQAVPGRSVRYALTRQQMFDLVGYRPATVQHVALGADREGRLTAITHDVVDQGSKIGEFVEPAAAFSRGMYAAETRRTTHRVVPLDIGVPTFMRAPGEAPGSFAGECAMDELAIELGIDPIELRLRNEPEVDPESGLPYSSRNLVACLRRGAERFGWADRDPAPRARLVDGWWHGTGVGSASFPVPRFPGSEATIRATGTGDTAGYTVEIAASDIGQGARAALTAIAADALDVGVERIDLRIGDTAFGPAGPAGGSAGTTSWGATIVEAADRFRDKYGDHPEDGDEADAHTPDNPWAGEYSMHAFGAHFVEVAVHADTGEIRVPRMLGVFAAGRIVNPLTARSQFLGGMTWGLSAALHEESVLDDRFGHVVNRDFAGYHVATNADVGTLDVEWLDEDDPYVNPMGTKGIGEIGIVGVAAAIANAAYHATGVRVRSLPITLDAFL
ncbi:xanthine dehydrogenase [Actinomycetospora sp. NBRC 106375]|uniref:xanthine dehydrogenase family protein molybdopterin-binding subunit n=1 Tax=Actinomycetospora sp. NBRC 106375 TaxID=3032207 RepID=UPI0024A4F0FD|nr:xanthine dehydrogenase family protein molybdopterin-binding subunit [Actinomycetospora sp. NBRC 106375]GLZ46940.1 xanthine dehydrogenase [Actinomycetospora sp. NBRC 106375]